MGEKKVEVSIATGWENPGGRRRLSNKVVSIRGRNISGAGWGVRTERC